MNKRVISETQPMLDLRHLANEVYPLLVEGANRHLAVELAETAWRKLRECGPVFDGFSGYVRALADGQAEWLTYHELGTRRYRWVCNLRRPEIDSDHTIWLVLQQAEACAEGTYARVRGLCETDLRQLQERSLTRWDECRRQLEAEGLLPVRRAVPSAAGGARFVTDLFLQRAQEPAFIEALAWVGGAVVERRPAGTIAEREGLTCLTVSLAEINDLYSLGRLAQAGYEAEQKGGGL